MSRVTLVALAVLIGTGCNRDAQARRAALTQKDNSAISQGPMISAALPKPSSMAPAEPSAAHPAFDPQIASEPSAEKTLEGHFRGGTHTSRVLFLDNMDIVHAWQEGGVERRETVVAGPPPGHRECKALRSFGGQDFLLCMIWYTGPGGGRVDGILFDLKRRILGEFFSAAINIQLLNTLCYPDTMVGPMPSYTVDGWETKDATADNDAEVRVTVSKEGWTTKEAAVLRAQPQTKKFCRCVGDDACRGEPTSQTETSTVVYGLTKDQLHPTEESKAILGKIAAQWGHNSFLNSWNLKMRGF